MLHLTPLFLLAWLHSVLFTYVHAGHPICRSFASLPNPLAPGVAMDPIPAAADFPSRCELDCPLGKHLSGAGDGVSPTADWRTFRKLVVALAHGRKKTLTVGVIGGSFATGKSVYRGRRGPNNPASNWNLRCNATCSSPNGDFQLFKVCPTCSFVARFEWWLRQAYPETVVTVVNFGVGASNSQAILPVLSAQLDELGLDFDVFYVAYSDNDSAYFLHDIHDTAEEDRRLEVQAHFELLLHSLLTRPSRPVVVNIDYFFDKRSVNASAGFWFDLHDPVSAHYRVPSLNVYSAGDPAFWNYCIIFSAQWKLLGTGVVAIYRKVSGLLISNMLIVGLIGAYNYYLTRRFL
jgi:hypothetical protein